MGWVRLAGKALLAVAAALALTVLAGGVLSRCDHVGSDGADGGVTSVHGGDLDFGGAPDLGLAEVQGERGEGADPALVGTAVSELDICREHGALVGTDVVPLGVRATWELDVGLVEAAVGVVEGYRVGNCSLESHGYIDLLGRVWSCTVASPEGWAELVLVDGRVDGAWDGARAEEGGAGCVLTVVRMGQEAPRG